MPKAKSKVTSPGDLKATARRVVRDLTKAYPEAKCALDFRNPFELLVATILSAQCTDVRVNMVTPALFAKYPNAKALAAAKLEDVEEIIRSTGFFRSKAKSLVSMSTGLCQEHGGEVPRDLEAMTALQGVGRKTANVVLGTAYGIASGVVVDTHVKRLTYRLGLTRQKDPKRIEQDLMEIVARKDWVMFSHLLILHGRKICVARKPKCGECVLGGYCPRLGVAS